MPDLDFGGVETVLEILARKPSPKSWVHIFVATRRGGKAASEIRAQGWPVFILGRKSCIPDFRLIKDLILIFRKFRPDLIHCRCVEANFHGVVAASFLKHIPVLIEEVGLTNDQRSIIAKRVLSYFYSRAAGIICPSLAIRRDLQLAGCGHHLMPIIPNPVDPKFLRPRVTQPKKFCFHSISRLVEEKNIPLLLSAFQLFSQKHPSTLKIFGEGPLRESLKSLCRGLDLTAKVRWMGFRARGPANLSGASAFLMTSRREGHGVALLEAMAAGVPVIATAVGGIKEILNKKSRAGILVPNNDLAGLTRAMTKIYRKGRTGRIQMGKTARKIVFKKFSPDRYRASLFSIYGRIMRDMT